MSAEHTKLLQECAEALRNALPPERQSEPVRTLLRALAYDVTEPAALSHHRANMLEGAAGFSRLFQLRAPEAPGLIFFGAEVDPTGIHPGGIGQPRLPASGTGVSFRNAFEACVGEGIELLSQFECADDIHFKATTAQAAASLHADISRATAALPDATTIDWITARQHLGDATSIVPADICLRRGKNHLLPPPWPLSIGCSAGTTFDAAVLHGLLELIERDAVALWWRGGMRGHLLPLDGNATRQAVEQLNTIRGNTLARRCWLLDITSDLGIPCVAAVSVDQHGNGFACGVAARLNLARAAQAAVLEMCQMELAHQVVAVKRKEGGDGALNAHDQAHLRRSNELHIDNCTLLHPLPPARSSHIDIATDNAAAALQRLLQHLQSCSLRIFVIDLTRPIFAVPVARVLCPMLEKEPSQHIGDRLQAAIQRTGGGLLHTGGIPLM